MIDIIKTVHFVGRIHKYGDKLVIEIPENDYDELSDMIDEPVGVVVSKLDKYNY